MSEYEILSRPAVVAPTLLFLSYFIYHLFFKPSPISQLVKKYNLPIVGARPGDWFPSTQAKWRNFLDFKAAAFEAYRISQTDNQACILPILGQRAVVHLPRSETQFVTDQPDHILSMHEQSEESLQLEYTLSDPYMVHNAIHQKIITTTLTSQIGNLVPDAADEAEWSFERVLGSQLPPGSSESEFKEVVVWDVMQRVIRGVTNRVMIGAPLCRNEDLLELALSYSGLVPLTARFITFFWEPIRPLVAPLLTLPMKLKYIRYGKLLKPEITRRLAEYDAHRVNTNQDLKPTRSAEEKNDFLQWLIHQAKSMNDPTGYFTSPSTLAGRVLLVNFASIHTTSFAMTHAILDIAYSPDREAIISTLRQEITSCLSKFGDNPTSSPGGQNFKKGWNKTALNAMHKLDSLLRESARLNSFVTLGLQRKVSSPDGLTTPLSKITIPKSELIAVPSYPIFREPDLYPFDNDPEEFKPFRWSQERDDISSGEDYLGRAKKAYATTSKDFMAFGHGRNACPGRFFASAELKLVLGFLLMEFDLEPVPQGDGKVPKRPGNVWLGSVQAPDFGAKVRIRRRQTT